MSAKKKRQHLGRPAKPFDKTQAAHTVVKVAEAMGWEITDEGDFLKRTQSVEYGLSAETEFAAILAWLGNCGFAHRFDQVAFSSNSARQPIPDLLVVFQYKDQLIPTLIEVKTTAREKLKIGANDFTGLVRYASVTGLPLLFAWRPRRLGFWVLVEPKKFKREGSKWSIDVTEALPNDLMSSLAGDFLVVPKTGAGIRIEMEIVGNRMPTKNGFNAELKVADVFFHDASGNRIKKIANSLQWLVFATSKEQDEVLEDKVIKSFVTVDTMIRAQDLLRAGIDWGLKEGERIHWRQVAEDFQNIVPRDNLLDEYKKAFGTFVQYIFYQKPKTWPNFVPQNWITLTKTEFRGASPQRQRPRTNDKTKKRKSKKGRRVDR